MADELCKEIPIELLVRRQEQHMKFFDVLESIRWKFTTAFGAAALVGLSQVFSSVDSADRRVAGGVLTVAVSIAGIITQVRIFALVVTIWGRVLVLQHEESTMLRTRYQLSSKLAEAFLFPALRIPENKLLHLMSVGMASCFVFGLLVGIVGTIAFSSLGIRVEIAIALGLVIALGLTWASYAGSGRYLSAVQSHSTGGPD